MRRAFALLSLTALLTACGVDGDPVPPETNEAPVASRVNISTDAYVGVGSSGTYVSGGVGLHRNNVSIRIGF